MQNGTPSTGMDLRLRRVRANVKVKDLADAMGVVPSRISAIERSPAPRPDTIVRYLSALDTCRTVPTSKAA
jgi:transcriptional regulator with XRE-family HTH domain